MKPGRIRTTPFCWLSLCVLLALTAASASAAGLSAITNVLQFDRLSSQSQQVDHPVRLEGTVCWADLARGMIVLQDSSGSALIEMDPQNRQVQPGEHITVEGMASEGRGGSSFSIGGLQLTNGWPYGPQDRWGSIALTSGKYPITASWYGRHDSRGFHIYYEGPNLARQSIPDSELYHAVISSTGQTNWAAGLMYKIYQGQWSVLPDFQKMKPCGSGTTANINADMRPDGDCTGVLSDGYLNIDRDGVYGFSLALDNRRQLFVENPTLWNLGRSNPPAVQHIILGQILPRADQSFWGEAEGVVTFVGLKNHGMEVELKSENGNMTVEIAEGSHGLLALLLGSRVQVTGICKGTYGLDGQIVPGTMWLPDLESVKLLEIAPQVWASRPIATIQNLLRVSPAAGTIVQIRGQVRSHRDGTQVVIDDGTGSLTVVMMHPVPIATGDFVGVVGAWNTSGTNMILDSGFCRKIERMNEATNPLPFLTTAEGVKRLRRDEALQGYPVKIQGVVTWSGGSGFVIQDSTMGIFSETVNPGTSGGEHEGEYLEVEGVTTAQFSPMVLARRIVHRGLGILPEPVRPTWDQLMNGTLDTQYAEVQGVVTAVAGTRLILLTHDGKLQVDLPEKQFSELRRCADALIRIRGCLWAVKDEETHKLIPGEVQIHSAAISVDQAAPGDLFDAPLKRVSELLLFDAKASALQRVRVVGQIIHQRDDEYFLMDGINGMRFIPRFSVPLKTGDQVEVVGFPLLGGRSPVLREAVARQIGNAELPKPRPLTESAILDGSMDSTLVTVDAQLMNLSEDQKDRVLGLQTGQHMFVACLARKWGPILKIPIGSRLQLTGVYVGQGQDRISGRDIGSFELLLNSPDDIRVLARPSWWTIKRMLVVVGVMTGILTAALVWIGLLRRQVEQRTGQLKEEILARQRIEQLRAVEEERSRIARDLHDDLGSSLTEISMLADAGAGMPPVLEKADRRFQTIGEKARAVVNALDVIVWLVNPRKDLLPFSVSYLGSYSEEYLCAAGIACRLKIPSHIPSMRMTADLRHNLFLAVKETLHNIVRHSKATEVNLEIALKEGQLRIVITDNGKGFSIPDAPNGNGLVNLKDRLVQLGGTCQVASKPDAGTRVSLSIPLPAN